MVDIHRYKGEWTETQVSHLLRRTMFGSTRPDVEYFLKYSPRKAVRKLVRAESTLPPPPVNNYNDDKYTDPQIAPGADWTVATQYDGMNNFRRRNSFKSW